METTNVPVTKTCAEIEVYLVNHGARQVWKEFNQNRDIESLEFVMPIKDKDVYFKLPLRWQAIQKLALQGKTGLRRTREEGQARKVAARLVLRWVQSQFALIDTGMVKMEEVFLPYITAPGGLTYFEQLETTGGLLALNSGEPDNVIDIEIDKVK